MFFSNKIYTSIASAAIAAPPMTNLLFPVTAGMPPVLVEVEAVLAPEVDPEPVAEAVAGAVVDEGAGVTITYWVATNGGRRVVTVAVGISVLVPHPLKFMLHTALDWLPEL